MKKFLSAVLLCLSSFFFSQDIIGKNGILIKTVVHKYNEIPASFKQGFSVMDGDVNAKDLVIRPDNEFDLAVTANLFINGSVSIIIFCNNFFIEENPKYYKAVFIVDGEQYTYNMEPAEQHYNDALKTLMVSQQPVDQNIFKLMNHIVNAKNEVLYTFYGNKNYDGKMTKEEILTMKNILKLLTAITEK